MSPFNPTSISKKMLKALALGLSLGFLTHGAQAQDRTPQCTQVQQDWTVCSAEGPKECYIVSSPKKSVITENGRVVQARRGEIQLFSVFRPSEKVKGQVTFTGGYPFANNTRVSLDIDGNTYQLISQGEWAWPDSSADQKLVSALKKGKSAILTGQSARGKITKDSFSLLGFTAAFEAARKACGQ